MNVTKYSQNRFYSTLNDWAVPQEYANAMFGYFVHGHQPGSFFTALLANDFADAISHSHPANTILSLKDLVGWLRSTMTHGIAWGDRRTVRTWLELDPAQRRAVLVERGLWFSEQDEIVKALTNERSVEPLFLD